MKRKIVSLMVSIMMVLGLFCALPATAAETVDSGTCGDSLIWVLDSAGTLTISGIGAMLDYTLPSSTTPSPWYSSCGFIRSVVIGSGVTAIGSYAFYDCTSLKSAEIPDTIVSIGDSAFSGCTTLVSIDLPEGITTINSQAFYNCSALTSTTVPSTVTTLGSAVFYGCDSMNFMRTGYLPEQFNLFFGGTRRIYNDGGSYTYVSYVPESLKTVEITSVSTIPYRVFQYCPAITSITIPDTVTSIGDYDYPLSHCQSLEYLKIGFLPTYFYKLFGDTQRISNEDGTYSTKTNIPDTLKTVEITSVSSISREFFKYCTELEKIIIPQSVTSVGYYAFSGISPTLYYLGTKGEFRKIKYVQYSTTDYFKDNLGDCSLIYGNTEYSTENGTLYLLDGMIVDYKGTDSILNIPASINGKPTTSIASYAFENNESLTKIIIPGSVETIDSFAITGCSNLSSIAVENGVKTISAYAFKACASLTSITIPNTVTSIGKYAFENCSSLTAITIPSSVETIGSSAFSGCSNLTSVTIENGVRYLSSNAFSHCTSLSSITIPGSVKTIDTSAFQGCSTLKSIIIEEGLETISDYAFKGCTALTSITIPNSVTSIGKYALMDCWNLQEVSVPFVGTSRTAGGATDGVFGYLFGKSTTGEYVLANQYYAVTSLVEYHIPSALKTVHITDATKIPYGAFAGCTGLEYISLNEGITDISRLAFSSCDILSVRMPASVSFIGTGAFESTDVKKLYVSVDSYCQDYAETNSYPYELYDYYPVTGVTLTETNVNIVEASTHTLTPVIAPENATYPSVTWKSSDENVATVSQSGVVTAVSRGTATITATTTEGGFSASCTVNILRSVTSVSLSHSELYIGVGNSKTLTATVYPVGASDKTVTWSSSDTRVATVTNGIVTAVGYGTATITVTTNDGGYTAKCIINSTVPVTSVSLNKTSANLYAGDTLSLIATVLPENAFDKTVTWTSSNEAVASVENGTVTAKSVGTAIITATTVDGERTATCTITVSALTPDTPENEDAPYVSLSSKKATAGSTIEVEVQIANNPGFVALGLEIEYDSTYLTLTGVKAENGVGATFTPAQSYGKIPFNFGWSSTDNVYYNGKLATLTFMVSENAPDGVYPISLSHYKGVSGNYKDGVDTNYDEDFQALGLAYVSANIAVISYTPGDINGDNTVNDRDATFLLRYLAGWTQDGIIEAALDTDGSGTVNDRDATLLLRYLASWDVELH